MLALVLASFTLFAALAVVMVGLRMQCSVLLHATTAHSIDENIDGGARRAGL